VGAVVIAITAIYRQSLLSPDHALLRLNNETTGELPYAQEAISLIASRLDTNRLIINGFIGAATGFFAGRRA